LEKVHFVGLYYTITSQCKVQKTQNNSPYWLGLTQLEKRAHSEILSKGK